MCGAWLLAMPGQGTSLSNAEFSEAAASNLCLPSPACRGRVGEPIRGRATIDEYGDNVQATALPGDHWRIVPDHMRITLPGVGGGGDRVGAPGLAAGGLAGQHSSVLHELKVISSS